MKLTSRTGAERIATYIGIARLHFRALVFVPRRLNQSRQIVFSSPKGQVWIRGTAVSGVVFNQIDISAAASELDVAHFWLDTTD